MLLAHVSGGKETREARLTLKQTLDTFYEPVKDCVLLSAVFSTLACSRERQPAEPRH